MSKKTPKLTLRLTGIINLLSIGLLVATIYGFLGRLHWFLDLFSHFRVQYMQLCLPLIAFYLWKRMNKRAVAVVLIAAINYAFVLPLYFGKPDAPDTKPIRAMLMNLNAGNGNTEQVLEAIVKFDPDLLLLEEVTPKWAHELAGLDEKYKYKIAEPQAGCFGIMLLSKHPLERGEVIEVGTAGVPSMVCEAYFPQGTVSVIGTHPLPPIGAEYANHRNNQLAELPSIVKEQTHPVLLIGDLNVTPFSPWFGKLVSESGLKNSMKGFGFQPSWIGNAFLKIPLDHVLHSEDIIIHNRMIGPNVGSDHLPVIVDFSMR